MAASANNPLIAAANKAAADAAAANIATAARGKPPLPVPTKTSETTTKEAVSTKKENVTTESSATSGGSVISAKTKRLHNPLSEYSSSTYRISLYMITPEAANAYSETGLWDLKSMMMIAQSGGVTKGVDAPRSPYLDLDLYIDNLQITTIIDNKELGVSTTSYEFRFQIVEPYGIRFPTDLMQAAIHMQTMSNKKRNITQPINALNSQYMIAIHFYGYDKDGKLTTGTVSDASSSNGVSSGAAFQRLFPVMFVKMTSRLENKSATYEITANMINHQVSYSKSRGTVPDSTTIKAGTVKEALDSLAASLNKKQRLLSSNDPKSNLKQSIPDEYEFVFEKNSGIGESTLVDKNHFVVSNTPMPQALSSMNINVRLSESGKAAIVKKQERQIQLAVGTPFMGVIDQVITQSSFLRDVLTTVDKEELSKVKETDSGFVKNTNPKPLKWYHVTPQVSIKDFDEKRQQYAYKITYKIQTKEIPYIRSAAVAKTTAYPGAYKQYDYWYTGKNAEILSYEQSYNLQYFNEGARATEAANTKIDKTAPTNNTAASGSGSTGTQPNNNAVVDTIRTSVYSPSDQINAHIKILGDPDFIMTSEAGGEGLSMSRFYGSDFSINPAAGQVFIEIGFNQVKDYDSNLGLLKPDNNILFWNYSKDIQEQCGNRMIYQVLIVKSRFSKGMFTQELTTCLPPFSEATGTNENPDERSESKAGTTKGKSNTGSGAGSAAFAATDPRRNDVPPATNGTWGKQLPILAPATSTNDDNVTAKGSQSVATVFTKDSANRDPVTLLPKR